MKRKKSCLRTCFVIILRITFLTVLSRSNAMSGILASSMRENRLANTFACL